MLSKSARLSNSGEFARATKSGFRIATANFVGYLYNRESNTPAQAGVIVSKSVGGSVVRHRVARKIRHALREEIQNIPKGSLLVIRALSKAAQSQTFNEISTIVSKLIKKSNEARTHRQ